MKNYYCVETDELIEFGDVLNITTVKETMCGKITIEKNITFSPGTLTLLTELGIIEERDVEDKETPDEKPLIEIDYHMEETLQDVKTSVKYQEEKIQQLETKVKDLEEIVSNVQKTRKNRIVNRIEIK